MFYFLTSYCSKYYFIPKFFLQILNVKCQKLSLKNKRQNLTHIQIYLWKKKKKQDLKPLFLLDLDHTLIYGSYAPSESAPLLFSYSQFLKVYERPYARQFIQHLQELGDIIIFTTAKEDYALQICEYLEIQPLEILSRAHCKQIGDSYRKELRLSWMQQYERLIIVDDSPNVWKTPNHESIRWIVPSEFRGDASDDGLLACIDLLKSI